MEEDECEHEQTTRSPEKVTVSKLIMTEPSTGTIDATQSPEKVTVPTTPPETSSATRSLENVTESTHPQGPGCGTTGATRSSNKVAVPGTSIDTECDTRDVTRSTGKVTVPPSPIHPLHPTNPQSIEKLAGYSSNTGWSNTPAWGALRYLCTEVHRGTTLRNMEPCSELKTDAPQPHAPLPHQPIKKIPLDVTRE